MKRTLSIVSALAVLAVAACHRQPTPAIPHAAALTRSSFHGRATSTTLPRARPRSRYARAAAASASG
jgi:hypothetical protein